MADQTLKAAKWLLSKRTELGVRFLEFKWNAEYGLPLFDFEVSIFNGRHVGRGTSPDQNIAFEKAVAESLERFVCSENGISTEGVAAHDSSPLAERNAKHEALERWRFHSHVEGEKPFFLAAPSPGASQITEALERFGATVSWLEMQKIEGYNSGLCLIQADRRFFLGMGFGENLGDVQFHAAIEALRNFAAYRENKDQFIERADTNPDLWNCSHQFFEKYGALFKTAEVARVKMVEYPPIMIQQLKSHSIPEIPLYFAKAKVTGEST